MKTNETPTHENIKQMMISRPHVVILGAGASCAAIPNGDKNGHKISAMNGFIQELGMTELLGSIKLQTQSNNLEDIYMELAVRAINESSCANIKKNLEKAIWDYMSSFVLPDNPTMYDYLVASLTKKDLIATFNWDPLLIQAYVRISKYSKDLPQLTFLHGNVSVGFCAKDNIVGRYGCQCPKCGIEFSPSQLLFPIKDKDYSSSKLISESWSTFEKNLMAAYLVTIIGYSAPKSDVAAINKMKEAWGDNSMRSDEQIEIVDLKEEAELHRSWEEFIHSHHYKCHKSFFETFLSSFPKQSSKAFFEESQECTFLDHSQGFKDGMQFTDIEKIIMKFDNK